MLYTNYAIFFPAMSLQNYSYKAGEMAYLIKLLHFVRCSFNWASLLPCPCRMMISPRWSTELTAQWHIIATVSSSSIFFTFSSSSFGGKNGIFLFVEMLFVGLLSPVKTLSTFHWTSLNICIVQMLRAF